jgi:hypothetical protein
VTTPAPEFDVYLSYSASDEKLVWELQQQLESAGIRVWWDREQLKAAGLFEEQVLAALVATRAMAVCVGPSGLDSFQLQEISAATGRAASDPDFLVAAVLLPGLPQDLPASALPLELASRPWIDLRSGIDIAAVSEQVSLLFPASPSAGGAGKPPATSSVTAAASRLGGEVTAAAFVSQLLELHPEYGERQGATIKLEVEAGVRASTGSWLERVRALLSLDAATELHGRLLIVGLARLDDGLRAQLDQGGFLATVEREIREPLASLFTALPAPPEETVPTHTDNPARVDELNREGVARILARRLRDTYANENAAAETPGDGDSTRGRSFLVHVHGPWGVGKTSLLNFLRDELHKKEAGNEPQANQWVVVTFNAWQHQRLAPPWWWLMTAVYTQGFHELWRISRWRALRFRAREWLWRLRGGWPGLLALLFAAALLVLIWRAGFFRELSSGKTVSFATVKALVVGVAALLTPLLIIWGVARSLGRWLLTASARGARLYMTHARDPLETMKTHFEQLVTWLRPYPLAIIIDDLDRCQPIYAVECLEGIQTLFREAPAVYVVAADREWIAGSYASEYASFLSAFDEPGRPLGYLFLEKTFQLTVQIPVMSAETRDDYWRRLIRPLADPEDRQALENARGKAAEVFAAFQTEEAVREELARNPGTTQAERKARLEAAAMQLASPKLEQAAEHVLHPFRPLLDANPRAMKRLVNAYGLARGIELLSRGTLGGDKQAQQRTALWTILTLRWPRLAEYLAVHPEIAASFGSQNGGPKDLPEEFAVLFVDQEVAKVMLGEADGVDVALDPDSIRLSVSA